MKKKITPNAFCFIAITLVFSFHLTEHAGAQTGVTAVDLSEAIHNSVNNHPLIKEAEDQVAIAQAKTTEQKSAFYPDATAHLSYNRIGPEPYFKLPYPGAEEFYIAPANNYNGNLTVSYLLYDFNRRKEVVKLFRSGEVTEAEKINVIKNQLAYQTVQVFYTLIYLQKNRAVTHEQIIDLKEHLAFARKMVSTGSAIGLDTLNTQVRLTVLKNRNQSLKNKWDKTAILLKSLMNVPLGKPISINGDLGVSAVNFSLDSLQKRALEQREELKLNKMAHNTVALQKAVIGKSNVPVVSLQGALGAKNGYPDNLNRITPNFVVGITASIPIFDGYLKKSKLVTVDHQLQSVDDQANVQIHNIITEVNTALLDLQNNMLQLKNAKAELKLATAALERANGLYRTGAITNTTLLDTQTSLELAKLKLTAQMYRVTLSRFKLLQATGQKIW